MDVFKLLSRGALIDRNGKHKKDLDLLTGKLDTSSDKDNKNNSRQDVSKDIDFFKSKKIDSTRNSRSKRNKGETEANEAATDSEEEGAFSELPLTIANERDAIRQRNAFRIKITGDDVPLPIGSFEDIATRFDLPKHLIRNLQSQDFTRPTAIQSEAIPIMIHERDLIACAPTGSGKTLAFSIPLVHSLKQHSNKGVRCLIISPTKELATQIYNEITRLSKGRNLAICILTKAQAAKMRNDTMSKKKYDILVTTPLRLVTSIKEELVDLSTVEHLVLDEADKLLEQGFVEQTDDILDQCTNPKLRKAMFSATIPSSVEEFANSIMFSPVRVIVGKKQAASQDIEQKLVYTGNEDGKLIAIRQMARDGGDEFVPPILIFVQSILRAKALFHELIYDKLNVDVIHGERSQSQRDGVIERFKAGDIWILICTEVLARGIDFRGVNLVINYDVPQSAQSYVHRIGRTGRAGRKGKAITFFTKDDGEAIKSVVNVMKESGCDVGDWMLRLPKLSNNTKKKIKSKPIDRANISTMPSVISHKTKQHREMVEASKRRKQLQRVREEKE